MIGYLRGTLLVRPPDDSPIVIDVGGVGFEVIVTQDARNSLGAEGEPVEMVIHTLVREDEITLYGFNSRFERTLFLLLIGVAGIGAKTAIHVLSQVGENTFIDAVGTGNLLPFTKTKGIGKKTAERIVLELRDKLPKTLATSPFAPTGSRAAKVSKAVSEVEQALMALGYRRQEISSVLEQIKDREGVGVEALLREAISRLKR